MSKTDKTAPYRVKKERGELPRGYVAQVIAGYGRPSHWRHHVKSRHAAERNATRIALHKGAEDIPPMAHLSAVYYTF